MVACGDEPPFDLEIRVDNEDKGSGQAQLHRRRRHNHHVRKRGECERYINSLTGPKRFVVIRETRAQRNLCRLRVRGIINEQQLARSRLGGVTRASSR